MEKARRVVWGVIGAAFFGAVAVSAGAAVLQDWAHLDPAREAGPFGDKTGSTVAVGVSPGPRAGEKALGMKVHLVDWAGAWALFKDGKGETIDLSAAKAVRFEARASQPEIVQIGFTDSGKMRYIASFRLVSNHWREFTLPLSRFKRDPYLGPGVALDRALDWSRIHDVEFMPKNRGDFILEIGPLRSLRQQAAAETGASNRKGVLMVQDLVFLDPSAYGPFTDGKGSSVSLALEGEGKRGRSADFRYDLKTGGSCGYWMRAGEVWGGQDWRGSKALELEVDTREPLQFQVGFNDANQNAYVAQSDPTRGKGWEKIEIPFDHFTLNPFYQPPGARKGAPLDLSHIETFNLSPVTSGKHAFRLRKVWILK